MPLPAGTTRSPLGGACAGAAAATEEGGPGGRSPRSELAAHLMAIGAPVEPVAPAIGTGL
jgi:hypothetical protein